MLELRTYLSNAWSVSPTPNDDFMGVWGSGPGDVWAVGSDSAALGVILHWNGSAWSASSDYVPNPLVHVSGVAGGSRGIWAVGSGGEILHHP